jgi:hypothetical protein
MSRFFKRTQDDEELTDEEIAAAELIVESSGKKVVSGAIDGLVAGQCFLCRAIGKKGSVETFLTNTSSYNLFVCDDCKAAFKTK